MESTNTTLLGANSSSVLESNVTTTQTTDCTGTARFVIHSLLASNLCLVGFLCNCVSCIVLRKDTASPIASFQLQALAITDNVFLALWSLQFSVVNYIPLVEQLRNQTWMYIRVYTYPLMYAAQMATVWLTVLIALCRYVAICVPYRASSWVTVKKNQQAVFGLALCSLLYNLPRFFENRMETQVRGNNVTLHIPLRWLADNKMYNLVYAEIMYYILSFVLPLVLLAFLNTRLTLAYNVVQRKRAAMRSRNDSHENNLTLVMIIVVLVFMLCNLPARLVQIIWKYRPQPCPTFQFFLMEFSNVLEVLNSSTNFFIYCVFRQKFRDILMETLCGKSGRSKSSPERETCTTKIFLNSNSSNNQQGTSAENGQEECDVWFRWWREAAA